MKVNSFVVVLSTIIKILLIHGDFSIIFFAYIMVIESLFLSMGYVIILKRKTKNLEFHGAIFNGMLKKLTSKNV